MATRSIALVLMLAAALSAAGCGSMLPTTRKTTQSPWATFDEAKASFDRIILHDTTVEELKELGFDPYAIPNVRILTYLDIMQRFMPNQSVRKEDLPEGIRKCIEAQVSCHGYEIAPQIITSKRYGNFLADLLRFKRREKESGWRFEALIVVINNTVVYKLWGGKPIIDEYRETRNPLGPLQDPASIVIDRSTEGL